MDTHSRAVTLVFSFCHPSKWESTHKGKKLLLYKHFPFISRPILGGLTFLYFFLWLLWMTAADDREAIRKLQELSPTEIKVENRDLPESKVMWNTTLNQITNAP